MELSRSLSQGGDNEAEEDIMELKRRSWICGIHGSEEIMELSRISWQRSPLRKLKHSATNLCKVNNSLSAALCKIYFLISADQTIKTKCN